MGFSDRFGHRVLPLPTVAAVALLFARKGRGVGAGAR